MDEGRKRVLGIIAGILVARHLKTTEDLSETRPTLQHRKLGCVCCSIGDTYNRHVHVMLPGGINLRDKVNGIFA